MILNGGIKMEKKASSNQDNLVLFSTIHITTGRMFQKLSKMKSYLIH